MWLLCPVPLLQKAKDGSLSELTRLFEYAELSSLRTNINPFLDLKTVETPNACVTPIKASSQGASLRRIQSH